jgi:O-antigen/teichoic acid export membrane protein
MALQLLGIVLSYMTIIMVSRNSGPAAQGDFATMRTFVDSSSVICLMGLPQALVLVINRRQTEIASIAPYIRLYGPVVFLLALASSIVLLPKELAEPTHLTFVLCISTAVYGFVTFSLVRATLLTSTEGLGFSLFTAMPHYLLFIAVAVLALTLHKDYHFAFAIQGLASLAISLIVLKRLEALSEKQEKKLPPLGALLSENLHSFFQALLYSSQFFLVFFIVRHQQGNSEAVGWLSIALLPVQVIHAVVGMASPYFYNRSSKLVVPLQLSQIGWSITKAAGLMQTLALISLPALGLFISLVFGSKFAPSTTATQLVLLGTFAVYWTRAITPFLQTAGRSMPTSISCAIRFASCLVLTWFLLQFFSTVVAGALAWLVSEWIAFFGLAVIVFRNGAKTT